MAGRTEAARLTGPRTVPVATDRPDSGMISVDDVLQARGRIAGGVTLTPCPEARALPELVPGRTHLKLENLQRTGSFKDRGALNRLLDLSEAERKRGVVTASAGNHAQAVAWHCSRLGIPATVVMPETTPLVKVANTRRFGARIFFRGATLSDAMTEVRRLEQEEHLTVVHAFDDDRVIAGQGTIGLELLEQVPDLTLAVVPIGGGGLISGIATVLKEARPQVRVIGVEASAAASATEGTPASASTRSDQVAPRALAISISAGATKTSGTPRADAASTIPCSLRLASAVAIKSMRARGRPARSSAAPIAASMSAAGTPLRQPMPATITASPMPIASPAWPHAIRSCGRPVRRARFQCG